jgi:uncharacterized damage-inducible protein DinB
MDKDHLIILVGYNTWADNRILDTAKKAHPDQLHEEAGLSHGSIFHSLRHTLDVEWSWRLACIGQPADQTLWEIVPLPDLDAVIEYWEMEHGRLARYIQGLAPEDLDRLITPSWMKHTYTIRHVIIHLVNHGTAHRDAIGWALTRLGQSPGELDFLDYLDTLAT